ncbi:hypothetical protein GYMLUDRAFT_250325 [Collybiopsis luxurians FD-317 M1]|uniref:Uncharacterized protein n=1 Tax=Collybiopsis luxurians FD-317 M1 TaxID=944289 RepID=A0A0D0BV93_9AGAR|nr:hypothetical protein GYMLUDRAFT_250325 [Collybiopsis luxurians FD-317 M1]
MVGMESFINHAQDTVHRLQSSFHWAHSSAISFPFLDTPLFAPESEDQGVQTDPIGTSQGMGTSEQAMAEEDWYKYIHEEEGDQDNMDIQEGEIEGGEVDNPPGYSSIVPSDAEGIDDAVDDSVVPQEVDAGNEEGGDDFNMDHELDQTSPSYTYNSILDSTMTPSSPAYSPSRNNVLPTVL